MHLLVITNTHVGQNARYENKKGKVVPVHVMTVYGASNGIASLIPNFGINSVLSTSRPSRFIPEKEPGSIWTEARLSLLAGVDVWRRKKISYIAGIKVKIWPTFNLISRKDYEYTLGQNAESFNPLTTNDL
jgi:hypothetical protein